MIQKLAFINDLECDENRSRLPFGFHSGSVNEKQTDLPASSFKFEEIIQVDRLQAIQPEWERLVEMAVEPNVFYQPEFLIPAFREYSDKNTSVLAIWAAPKVNSKAEPVLCGLVPLQLRKTIAGIPCKIVEFWKHDHTYLTTPLFRRDILSEVWNGVAEWIQEHCTANFFHLPLHAADGVFHRTLVDWLVSHERETYLKQRYARAFLIPEENAESYVQRGLSRKKRHETKRSLNRLRDVGEITFFIPQTPAEVESWSNDFLNLEQSGWKGQQGTAMAGNAANRRFWKSLIHKSFQLGRLMPLAMRTNGQTIASKCNLMSGDSGIAFKIAFAEEYAKFSPGTLLEIENIHQLHETRINGHKVRWMDSCASNNHPMIDSLWPDRRIIESLYISTDRKLSRFMAATLPFLAWIKRSIT